MRRIMLGAGLGVLALMAIGTAAPAAAALCPAVFVPEGYAATCSEPAGAPWRLEVRPEDAPLGELNRLTIRPLEEPVEDPFSWLQEQLVVDLNGFRSLVEDLLEHPENPFSGLIAPELFGRWLDQLGLLGHLPLRGCAYPFELVGQDVWQMDCSWSIGPVRQFARLQLVEAGGDPYLVTIWTVDERRQRHLQAIANSLQWRA